MAEELAAPSVRESSGLGVTPTVVALRAKAASVVDAELARLAGSAVRSAGDGWHGDG